jgi:xanthine dehydrogenase accessory factor
MSRHEIAERASELRRQRIPFVHARVIFAERPTSAKAGDEAIVLSDGTIDGFVGGDCAESTVRAQALAVLDSGESIVLRISPAAEPSQPGKLTMHNPCLSGGILEIFLEPQRPAPLITVVGDAPVARAVVAIGRALGYEMVANPSALPQDTVAVVVASHGRDEVEVLAAALRAGVPYVGLVASRKRGEAVVGSLDLCVSMKSRVVTPAGLDIGAFTPEEVALSILADIVDRRPRPSGRSLPEHATLAAGDRDAGTPGGPMMATDPVCQMTVAAVESSLHIDHLGERYFFCGSGCLRAFADAPTSFVE